MTESIGDLTVNNMDGWCTDLNDTMTKAMFGVTSLERIVTKPRYFPLHPILTFILSSDLTPHKKAATCALLTFHFDELKLWGAEDQEWDYVFQSKFIESTCTEDHIIKTIAFMYFFTMAYRKGMKDYPTQWMIRTNAIPNGTPLQQHNLYCEIQLINERFHTTLIAKLKKEQLNGKHHYCPTNKLNRRTIKPKLDPIGCDYHGE